MMLSTKRLLITLVEILVGLLLGIAITAFGWGSIAWIFGGMGAGLTVSKIYQISLKKSLQPNKNARKLGQAMVGLAIGFAIAESDFIVASSWLPLFIFLTLFMLLCSSVIGYFYARWSHTNLFNAMLATMPGGVATMSGIAAEYNRNVSLVAMVQTLRITSVIIIIPLMAGSSGSTSNSIDFLQTDYLIEKDSFNLLLLAIILTYLGIKTAKILRIPSAYFFGSLITGIIFNHVIIYLLGVNNPNFTPPQIISLIGQILLGITVGEAWSDRVKITGKNIFYASIAVLMTITSGFIAAIIATQITTWDWLTCILVTAPGGSTEMILVALALNHHPEIVTIAHSVRLMGLNLCLPLWIYLLRHWEKTRIDK